MPVGDLGNLELEDKLVLDLDGKKHWFFHGDIFDVTMQGSRWLAKLGTTGYEILILINKLVNFFLTLFGDFLTDLLDRRRFKPGDAKY